MSYKITDNTNSVEIGHFEFPKNTLWFNIDDNTGKAEINVVGGGRVATGNFADFKNSSNEPYGAASDLRTDLKSILFA